MTNQFSFKEQDMNLELSILCYNLKVISMLTNWQKIILINYGVIDNSRIAKVLETTEETVETEAKRLGINHLTKNKDFVSKGFVTIIRNNYNLLPNECISVLLGIDISEFNYLLKNYDFLDVKLGKKPDVENYLYFPLNETQKRETESVARHFIKIIKPRENQPFDFYKKHLKTLYSESKNPGIPERFVGPYNFDYLNSFGTEIDEEYLDLLKETGTTGIWISGTLRDLVPFTFDESCSNNYKTKIQNLNEFIECCKKHGIDVYLYLNEPRSLPDEFFKSHEDLRGNQVEDGSFVFCLNKQGAIDYIYNSTKYIVNNVPHLKGIMTITMSENPTHCFYKNNALKCSYCPFKNIYDVPVLINNTIMRAIKDAESETTLIANLWGWSSYMGFSTQDTLNGIKLLDKDIAILCVSEASKDFVRNKKHNRVVDYSISVVGPSELSKKSLLLAKQLGRKTYAKIQINNSWECSAVPYIPAFNLMEKHVKNVRKLGVNGLMLGWSLGGYPGGFLPIANMFCQKEEYDSKHYYQKIYKKDYSRANKAIDIFSKAFKKYPFDVSTIYLAPHTLGPANLWYLDKTKKISTMVCYSYNDIQNYTRAFGADYYLSLMKQLLNKWKEGLDTLEPVKGNPYYEELKLFANATYIHLKSAYNTVRFYYEYQKVEVDKEIINKLIDSELQLTTNLYNLIIKDSRIGFEMTNHYYYVENNLLLKIANLLEIKDKVFKNERTYL